MVLLTSLAPKLGTQMPPFTLPDVHGNMHKSQDFIQSQALLVVFMCNHCPYVRAIEDRLIALAHTYEQSQLQVLGICSNDWTQYPQDTPQQLSARWHEKNYGFPYLLDETQQVAKDFHAVCTPEFFLYDQQRTLYYTGRFDDNWQHASQVTQNELEQALQALLAGDSPPTIQHPSMGCSIKWRPQQ
ncbi:MAG: thioredoxin family protein [Myxococcota bacterium]